MSTPHIVAPIENPAEAIPSRKRPKTKESEPMNTQAADNIQPSRKYKDEFDTKTKNNTEISKDRKFAKKREHIKEGATVNLKRKVIPGKKNMFSFRIVETNKSDIWVGCQMKPMKSEKRFEWWIRLWDGKIYSSQTKSWKPFTKKPISAFKDDIITMMVENGRITYYLNSKLLGVAFKDDRLNTSERIFPMLFLGDEGDSAVVEVLPGQLI